MTELLTGEEVAARLKVPRSTLTGWRYKGDGPPSFRVGKHLRYDADELERWLQQQAAKQQAKGTGTMMHAAVRVRPAVVANPERQTKRQAE